MMEFENRNFETEYRGSYVRKTIAPLIKYKIKQEFQDPITEGFKHYLSTDVGNEEEKIENCNDFTKRYGENNPKIAERYFKEPLNTAVVDNTEAFEKKTAYHQHFCSFDGYEKFLPTKEKPRVPLPEGWVEGTTTHKWSYRNPVILFPNIYKTRPSLFRPLCEMDEAYKHSLKSKNVSELAGTIGELGTFILENEMHGSMQKLDL
ncbi:uncharacterized protein LOC123309110 [Coccinella septempunctata]|uniref:uncharacterized protein LOC123309110 n=1 Tax=Coccinella septempunctata TaxID=41139 RepID=UPI001D094B88|nr:uncharacterized protein LOC123309110 [Coccinella septempunctata]